MSKNNKVFPGEIEKPQATVMQSVPWDFPGVVKIAAALELGTVVEPVSETKREITPEITSDGEFHKFITLNTGGYIMSACDTVDTAIQQAAIHAENLFEELESSNCVAVSMLVKIVTVEKTTKTLIKTIK